MLTLIPAMFVASKQDPVSLKVAMFWRILISDFGFIMVVMVFTCCAQSLSPRVIDGWDVL